MDFTRKHSNLQQHERKKDKIMTQHFNRLTEAELERLAMLSEECGEVVQIIGKILRHGYDSYHPNDPSVNNRDLLEKEVGDVEAAIHLLLVPCEIRPIQVAKHKQEKLNNIRKYSHHF